MDAFYIYNILSAKYKFSQQTLSDNKLLSTMKYPFLFSSHTTQNKIGSVDVDVDADAEPENKRMQHLFISDKSDEERSDLKMLRIPIKDKSETIFIGGFMVGALLGFCSGFYFYKNSKK